MMIVGWFVLTFCGSMMMELFSSTCFALLFLVVHACLVACDHHWAILYSLKKTPKAGPGTSPLVQVKMGSTTPVGGGSGTCGQWLVTLEGGAGHPCNVRA